MSQFPLTIAWRVFKSAPADTALPQSVVTLTVTKAEEMLTVMDSYTVPETSNVGNQSANLRYSLKVVCSNVNKIYANSS